MKFTYRARPPLWELALMMLILLSVCLGQTNPPSRSEDNRSVTESESLSLRLIWADSPAGHS
jgi:hypothetical protein